MKTRSGTRHTLAEVYRRQDLLERYFRAFRGAAEDARGVRGFWGIFQRLKDSLEDSDDEHNEKSV